VCNCDVLNFGMFRIFIFHAITDWKQLPFFSRRISTDTVYGNKFGNKRNCEVVVVEGVFCS
jgi:hypothetical protein